MFPHAAEQAFPVIMTLAVVGIIYGAMVALLQPDMKRLVAYSSVSHMGFVMLGLYAFNNVGVTGSVLQMINHGLSTGALFILVGYIYHRRHTRLIEEYGGLWSIMPTFAALFLVITLSSIGLPGTNGFVGEFLILLGAFRAHWLAGGIGVLRRRAWRRLHADALQARLLRPGEARREQDARGSLGARGARDRPDPRA